MIVIILAWCTALAAQINAEKKIQVSENQPVEDLSSLALSFDYSDNSDITGKLSETIDQPLFSASVSFLGKSGFDATAIGSFIGNSDESLSEYTSELDIMLGYQFKFIRSLTVHPGYSRFMYSRKSSALQKLFTDELHVDVDYSYRFLNIGLSPSVYVGKHHTFRATFRNYYTINFSNVLFRNTLLHIQPGIDLNFGNFEYLNMFYIDRLKENDDYYKYLLLSREIRHYVYLEKINNPELTVYEILDIYLEEQIQDHFKLTSAVLYLPINYFAGNFCINVGMYAFIPVIQPEYLYNDLQFFFTAGISYNLIF